MRTFPKVLVLSYLYLFVPVLNAADMISINADALMVRAQKLDESFVIVDVRAPEEFAQGHVPGAINIPQDKLADRIGELMSAKNKDIVLYCKSGRRSAMAAETLQSNGFTHLLHLDGDIQKWLDEKRPIEK